MCMICKDMLFLSLSECSLSALSNVLNNEFFPAPCSIKEVLFWGLTLATKPLCYCKCWLFFLSFRANLTNLKSCGNAKISNSKSVSLINNLHFLYMFASSPKLKMLSFVCAKIIIPIIFGGGGHQLFSNLL